MQFDAPPMGIFLIFLLPFVGAFFGLFPSIDLLLLVKFSPFGIALAVEHFVCVYFFFSLLIAILLLLQLVFVILPVIVSFLQFAWDLDNLER